MENKRGIVIHPEELTERMIGMLEKTGFQVLGLHPVGGPKAADSLEKFLELFPTREFQEKLKRVRGMGMAIEYELHALSWLLPRELYGTHPGWFRENWDGERVCDHNMCASNEEALDYLSRRAARLAALLPSDTGKYYFWTDDGKDCFCHCEKCRKLGPSDQALILYNAILRGIRSVDRDARQCFLAYVETMEPPRVVRPGEGIFLEYAPYERDTKRPMCDAGCQKNRENAEKIGPLLSYFGRRDCRVLEYWMDNSLFSRWKKPPAELSIDEEVIRSDIRFYREWGFEEITTFGCYLSDDYIERYGEPPIGTYSGCFTDK